MRRSRKEADNKPISRLGLYRKYKKLIDFEMFTHTRKIIIDKYQLNLNSLLPCFIFESIFFTAPSN